MNDNFSLYETAPASVTMKENTIMLAATRICRRIFFMSSTGEKLLKRLYSSIIDSYVLLDGIENCLCDDE